MAYEMLYSQELMKNGVAIVGEDEKGVFEALGLQYPEPEKLELSTANIVGNLSH
jgi:hypothetical protein